MTAANAHYFESIHEITDPFGYQSRWYEARKREVLLATLPRKRFPSGWELGCSNGELSAALAQRCERLLVTDISANAIAQAQSRLAGLAHVRVQRMAHPKQWPTANYSLVVLSEVGYYLSTEELDDTIDKLADSVAPEGLLVACHWLHPFAEAHQDGRQVHDRLARALGLPLQYRYEDGDFLLEAWGMSTHTVAQLEGLR